DIAASSREEKPLALSARGWPAIVGNRHHAAAPHRALWAHQAHLAHQVYGRKRRIRSAGANGASGGHSYAVPSNGTGPADTGVSNDLTSTCDRRPLRSYRSRRTGGRSSGPPGR